MEPQPFWERGFQNLDAPSPFGQPGEELVELWSNLPQNAFVLDLGCGDGRNALFLARRGCKVKAVDISAAAIAKLGAIARREGLPIEVELCDLRAYEFEGIYDLVMAHGCLHLLGRDHWARLLAEAKRHTRRGGYHVMVVFTDAIPPPDDLRPWMVGLFGEAELFSFYSDWSVVTKRSYVLDDEHPGGIKHRHPINKLVAQHPDDRGRHSHDGRDVSLPPADYPRSVAF